MKANINASATTDFRTMLDREAETHLRCRHGPPATVGRIHR
jgi:hypothetical protein